MILEWIPSKQVDFKFFATGGAASGGSCCLLQTTCGLGDTSSLLLVEQPPVDQISNGCIPKRHSEVEMLYILDIWRVWVDFMDLEGWEVGGCIAACRSLPPPLWGLQSPSPMLLEEWCLGVAASSLGDLGAWRP